ncbi:MAG: hypothetical protein GDA53_03970 [Rhodobacteraceae bacterium]|nr:hypothetical protein [Paracoccaceae bacterium]
MPARNHSYRVHASSLAFEMSEGRTPVIANMSAAPGLATGYCGRPDHLRRTRRW